MEGTGILADGRTLNVMCRKQCNYNNEFDCFGVLPKSQAWGLGSKSNPLMPLASVAVNKKSKNLIGKTIVVDEFKGLKLPNGQTHNGCVSVDDECPSCGSHIFDFFAAKKSYSDQLYRSLGKYCINNCKNGLIGITYEVKQCKPLKYKVSTK